MRFAVASAAVVGVAAAQWGSSAPNATASDVYVTEVVTAFTTFCPEATLLTHAGSTITVSQATTLTITNCHGGCTITHLSSSSTPVAPVSESSTLVPYTSVSASSSASPVAPVSYSSAPVIAPYPSSNGTTPAGPTGTAAASGTSSATSSSVPYTGAATKLNVAGAGLLALFGLVAAL